MKERRNVSVKKLLNGTLSSLQSVVPIHAKVEKPLLLKENFRLYYGVLIGVTGDIKGKLVFTGEPTMFGLIGEKMFGMPLEGEMLESFSGELGNMIAGGISTNMAHSGTNINITSPTILQGNTTLCGYDQAMEITANFTEAGKMKTYLLLD